MEKIDPKKVGALIRQCRLAKQMTQKELADKFYLSDSTISKWERGLGLPDVDLLIPLAHEFEITVSQLLLGSLEQVSQYQVDTVDQLIGQTIELKLAQQEKKEKIMAIRQKFQRYFMYALIIFAFENLFLYLSKVPILIVAYLVPIGLLLIFAAWFFFGIKESLPSYYDDHKISFYTDGIFRMNLVGVSFNNQNWPHILRRERQAMLILLLASPLLYFLLNQYEPKLIWLTSALFVITIFASIYIGAYQAREAEQG